MKIFIFASSLLALVIAGCSSSEESQHPFAEYFFPYNSEPQIYCYRNVTQGMEEEFKRVYAVDDSYGKHIVVETYADMGRLKFVHNFNLDSLNLIDYAVVNKQGVTMKTDLLRDKFLPWTTGETTWFAARFPGFIDSTFILEEMKRSIGADVITTEVMGKSIETLVSIDSLRWTMVQPFTKKENEIKTTQTSYFAKGIGLVEYFGPNKEVHFKLEKIITQKEWVNMIR